MHGLFRVRGFTQDDAHIFCLPEQIESEIRGVLDLTEELLGAFGFTEYEVVPCGWWVVGVYCVCIGFTEYEVVSCGWWVVGVYHEMERGMRVCVCVAMGTRVMVCLKVCMLHKNNIPSFFLMFPLVPTIPDQPLHAP